MRRLLTWTHLFPMNSTTTPCQWNDSPPPLNQETSAENPWRTLYTSVLAAWLRSTHWHQTQGRRWQSIAKLYSPTLTLYNYPQCTVQIHQVFGENVFSSAPPNTNQRTKLRDIWPGAWPEGSVAGQRSPQRQVQLVQHLIIILAASSLCDKTHSWSCSLDTSRWQHTPYFTLSYNLMFLWCFCFSQLPVVENMLSYSFQPSSNPTVCTFMVSWSQPSPGPKW